MTEYALHFFLIQLASGGKEIVDVGDFGTNVRFGTGSTDDAETGELSIDSYLARGADRPDNIAAADVTGKRTDSDGLITDNKSLFFRNGIVDTDHGSTPDVDYYEDEKDYSFFFTRIMCI